ncbi:hypothetical protein EMPS_08023 [Entomortierella parvispora]|uniref:Uncharacterized protein n=1 Tax=Entomortierella parvispora TaxID=205924 RepID=A0A9P3HFM0_9FUNG|nr:hypothetical protein EMPS_08023 [Entomortierella parvispora]
MDLLCNLEGWNVVVVADTKSPKDWKCGSCVYLSVEEQPCLNYEIHKALPYKAYTRKNIGYLWAIQQGAKKIFDTDDDNLPNGKDIILESPTEGVVGYRKVSGTGKSVNIYSHFGRPDIWPRGFPLEEIDVRRPVAYLPEYDSLSVQARRVLAPPMLIQQGLADLDPDVDAIFRLTQGQELKKAKFCKKSPSIRLSPGTFSPFNSQNTLFTYDAFWGLLLPTTVSFRVCDIWRGYWVQRLLWDVGGSLGFTKPTVDQIRNAHNYLDDYVDELQFYSQTSDFIDFLASWKSSSWYLETRIVDLMMAMAEHKFIGVDDVKLAKRWIKDLKDMGYVFPRVSRYDPATYLTHLTESEEPRLNAQKSRQLSNLALKECQAQASVDPTMARIQITATGERDTRERFKDILLVVNFNHPTYAAIKPFLFMYGPYFPNIKFYGPKVPAELKDTVTENPYDEGATGYRSLVDAMEKYPDYKGYLYTNDDTVLNVFQIATFDQDKVWKEVPSLEYAIHDLSKPRPEVWHLNAPPGYGLFMWDKPETGKMYADPTSLTEEQLKRIAAFTKVDGPVDVQSYADAVYVPRRIAVELTDVLKRFLKHNVFLELGVGLALIAVEPTENWESWKETYLWFGRDKWHDFMVPGVGMIHPVKVSKSPAAARAIVDFIESVNVV